jgi:hypothetical protein
MIATVDQDDLDIRPLERARGRNPCKSAANDHHTLLFWGRARGRRCFRRKALGQNRTHLYLTMFLASRAAIDPTLDIAAGHAGSWMALPSIERFCRVRCGPKKARRR